MKAIEIKNEIERKDTKVKDMLKGITGENFVLSSVNFINSCVEYSSKTYTITLHMRYLYIDDVQLFDELYDSIYQLRKENKLYEYYS